MNEQTLELQIKSKADEASSSIDKLIKSLTNIESTVNKIQVSIDGTSNKATTRTDKLKKNIDSVKSIFFLSLSVLVVALLLLPLIKLHLVLAN